MDIDDLSMLTDDQINYATLSEEVLEKLVFGDDLFVATSSLSELSKRESPRTSVLAWEILSTPRGDRYLQAAALGVLSRFEREKTLSYIKQSIEICDPYIFNSMLEIMVDEPEYFKSGQALEVVNKAFERLERTEETVKWPDVDTKELFLREYSKGTKRD